MDEKEVIKHLIEFYGVEAELFEELSRQTRQGIERMRRIIAMLRKAMDDQAEGEKPSLS
jgi:hypothetical protein